MTINEHGQRLITLVEKAAVDELFKFLQTFIRQPFATIADVLKYRGAIDDQIDFIDTIATKYQITALIIAAGKGSFEKVKLLLVHGANPNKQCATGDTALNLAAHRQKFAIVELLLEYNANPNIANQAGKTALHRAIVSYTNENAKQIQTLLMAGADTRLEDQHSRGALDEAILYNRTEALDVLLSHDQSLVQRANRASNVAARLGHDKCLEILFNHGMDANISDETNTSPLHFAVRSLRLTTIRLLMKNGADPWKLNNRDETPISIAQNLPTHEKEPVLTLLNAQTSIDSIKRNRSFSLFDEDFFDRSDVISLVSSVDHKRSAIDHYPLLRTRSNWTLENEKFRSSTALNSSVENLLDPSPRTFWTTNQSTNAWVIFDLKREFLLSGIQLIGSGDASNPKDCRIELSTYLNGPWSPLISFVCSPSESNSDDVFFPPVETRFIRLWICDNYGEKFIRIQNIRFYGVDLKLIDLLREFDLENNLNAFLIHKINDVEILDAHRDEIVNSSDIFTNLNDHFKFINLTSILEIPKLTFLHWFDHPRERAMINETFPPFSVIGDKGTTDRVRLEEQLENSPELRMISVRDLEVIQDYSLVDFSDYRIRMPGRYRIRVVSVETPDIQTPWHEVVVGKRKLH